MGKTDSDFSFSAETPKQKPHSESIESIIRDPVLDQNIGFMVRSKQAGVTGFIGETHSDG